MITVCYFGNCNITFGRSYALSEGLQLAGVTIIECQSQMKGLSFYKDLYKKHKSLKGEYDVIFIGNSGPSNFVPLLAKLISKKKVIWEPLFSIYDNYIFDRKVVPKWSIKALYYFCMDWAGVHASDLVVLDTRSNCKYFIKTFGGDSCKYTVALIGADTDIFKPVDLQVGIKKFEVEYHGKYIPVQGTEVIIKAAKLLENDQNIHFTMIGGGQMYKETIELAHKLGIKNVTFIPFQPLTEVALYVAQADVCLGLLGDVSRVQRAIPNKLYEAAAVGRVCINADTAALREVFTSDKDVVSIPQGDHEALAHAIKTLKGNGRAPAMGRAALETLIEKVSVKDIGEKLYIDIENLLQRA